MCCGAESFRETEKMCTRFPNEEWREEAGRRRGGGRKKSYVYAEFTDRDGLKFLIRERDGGRSWRANRVIEGEKKKNQERRLDPLFGPRMFESSWCGQWSVFKDFWGKSLSSFLSQLSLRHQSCRNQCQVSNPQRKVQSSPVFMSKSQVGYNSLWSPNTAKDTTFNSFNFLSCLIYYFQGLISSEPHGCWVQGRFKSGHPGRAERVWR